MKARLKLSAQMGCLVLCFAALSACEARNPSPDLQSAETAVTQAEPLPKPAPPPPAIDGLELFDTATGLSIIDAAPQDDLTGLAPPKFALHCDAGARTLEAVAPVRLLGADAVSGPASLEASGQSFPGEAIRKEDGSAVISLTLDLTPGLLAALATTQRAGIAKGKGLAESNMDKTGAFPGFAGQCSLKSGVPLPPP